MEIVRKHYGLPATAEVSIFKPRNDSFKPIRNMIRAIDSMRYTSDQKIEAIRLFRDTARTSLYDAKDSIENWQRVRSWLIKNRKFPDDYAVVRVSPVSCA